MIKKKRCQQWVATDRWTKSALKCLHTHLVQTDHAEWRGAPGSRGLLCFTYASPSMALPVKSCLWPRPMGAMKSHDPTPLLHGLSVYCSELVGIPLGILWPWHTEWAFTAAGTKLGNLLSLVSSLSSTARFVTLVSKSCHLQPSPYPQQGKSMTVLTAVIGNSPSNCPLKEKEKLPSQGSDKHLPSARHAVRWG